MLQQPKARRSVPWVCCEGRLHGRGIEPSRSVLTAKGKGCEAFRTERRRSTGDRGQMSNVRIDPSLLVERETRMYPVQKRVVTVLLILLGLSAYARAEVTPDNLFEAIAMVESHHNPNKINYDEDAVGYVQLRRIAVDDVNRIVGQHRFTYADRYSIEKSREMFDLYTGYWGAVYHRKTGNAVTPEIIARIYNGGPNGYKKESTVKYWNLVRSALDAQEKQ